MKQLFYPTFFFVCITKVFLLLFLISINCTAQRSEQASEIIYKDWQMLSESKTMIDVSYRIVKCGEAVNQIHLFVFNENSKDQKAHFTIGVTNNSDKKNFSKEINYVMMAGDLIKAKCESPKELDMLKIELPRDYDPNNISISITY